jgi:predicted enzyme related to lactoylglutathione lyase
MAHPEHGEVGYLQIPAKDIAASAAFYEAVFGWEVEEGSAGFSAPGIFGQFFTEHQSAPSAGPLLWLVVHNMDAALEKTTANGGELRSAPADDGPTRVLATITDPAGNTVGLVAMRS